MIGSEATKNQIKFGFAVCRCGKEFTKRRHGQIFCSVECGNEARAKRAGRVSDDPRYRNRRLRTFKNRSMYPYTGKPCRQPNLDNEINVIEEEKSESKPAVSSISWPVDLIGGKSRSTGLDRDLLRTVVDTELATVPVIDPPWLIRERKRR